MEERLGDRRSSVENGVHEMASHRKQAEDECIGQCEPQAALRYAQSLVKSRPLYLLQKCCLQVSLRNINKAQAILASKSRCSLQV